MNFVLLDFLRTRHPYGYLSNIFTFLWCLWKARNDFLFDRKKSLPHHVQIAANALSSHHSVESLHLVHHSRPKIVAQVHLSSNQLTMQGQSLKFDILIKGPKVYSDAALSVK